MRPLQPRERNLLWGLGLLALVAAFYLLFYSPKTNEAAALTKQLGAQQADVPLEKAVQQKKDLEREIADLQSAIRVMDAKLPSTREIPELLLQLDDLAGQTGITVTSVKPGVPQTVTEAAPITPTGRPRIGESVAPPAPAALVSRTPKVSQPETVNYHKFAIDVETKGTFSATLRFVHGLESTLPFLTLSDIRLTPAPSMRQDNPEDPVLSLHVTATGYVRPESGDFP